MPTTTNTSNIEILQDKRILAYPLELGNSDKDSDGVDNQFMMIKIRTSEKSTKLREDASAGPVLSPTRTGTGMGLTNADVTKALADSDNKIMFSDAAINAENWTVQEGMQKLNKVIVLPMPNDHTVGTSVKYNSNYDPGSLTKGGDMINDANGTMAAEYAKLIALQTVNGDYNQGPKPQSGTIINAIKTITSSSYVTSTSQILASDRQAINPRKEVMFEDFSFRRFNFVFTFAPKSQKESEEVSAIIETLRYYSLPELSPGKVFYIFPAEFEVLFILGKKMNPNIPRMMPSVLERVSINYSPGSSGWSTLPNGAPVALSMSLDFLELELVDRTRIWSTVKNPDGTPGVERTASMGY